MQLEYFKEGHFQDGIGILFYSNCLESFSNLRKYSTEEYPTWISNYFIVIICLVIRTCRSSKTLAHSSIKFVNDIFILHRWICTNWMTNLIWKIIHPIIPNPVYVLVNLVNIWRRLTTDIQPASDHSMDLLHC